MKKEEAILDLGGFSAAFGALSNEGESGSNTPVNELPIVDPSEITETEEEEEEEDLQEDEVEEVEEEEEEEEEILDPDKSSTKEEEVDVIEGFGDYEPELASVVQEKLFESFGWEIEEGEQFNSIDDISKFIQKTIDDNSIPVYASEEVKAMDEYVRNGGELSKYFDSVHKGVQVDNFDIDNVKDQKEVVKENLKLKGYTEERITRALERYEDAGTLKEEAEDALDLVIEYKNKISERLLEEQRNEQAAIRERQQKYLEDVENEIEGLSDIRGIAISKAEKKQLMDYMFKPTSNGRSQYQNDYEKSQKNLIESAYFTMKGDKLVQKVTKKANSEAAQKLRDKLASKGKRGKDQGDGNSGGSYLSFLEAANRQLKKPF